MTLARRAALTFFFASAAVVAAAFVLGRLPRSFDDALRTLVDGGPDGAERLECLQVLLGEGLQRAARDDVRAAVIAACAAIELREREEYAKAVQLAAGRTLLLPNTDDRGTGAAAAPAVDAELLREASLAQAHLRNLLLANAAANAGRRDDARTLYEQARLSAAILREPLAVELASAGVARVTAK